MFKIKNTFEDDMIDKIYKSIKNNIEVWELRSYSNTQYAYIKDCNNKELIIVNTNSNHKGSGYVIFNLPTYGEKRIILNKDKNKLLYNILYKLDEIKIKNYVEKLLSKI